MTMQDRYLPRVWTDEGYYYPVFSELGITYENPKFGSKYEEMKNLDWVYAWFFGENDLEFKYKLEMPTGLKDKNGKLIYEGDIIRRYVGLGKHGSQKTKDIDVVKWSINGYVLENYCDYFADTDDFEVIGNIHENADLLENKDD